MKLGTTLAQSPTTPVAGLLEDVGLIVLVDGHDILHAGDARQVLAGPGDAHGYVQLRANGLSRQAHLMGVGDPTSVAGRAGGANSPIQDIGQLLQHAEGLRPPQTSAAAHDHAGVL